MSDQVPRELVPAADEPADGLTTFNAFVPGVERAPPPQASGGQPAIPKEIAPGVLWDPRTRKIIYLPPERSTLAHIINSNAVWLRLLVSVVVVMALVGGLAYLGVNLIIVGATGTATALGVATLAYSSRRRGAGQLNSDHNADLPASAQEPGSGDEPSV